MSIRVIYVHVHETESFPRYSTFVTVLCSSRYSAAIYVNLKSDTTHLQIC
jgi:hypothetical protein